MKIDADTDAYRLAVAAEIQRLRLEAKLSMVRLAEDSGLSQPLVGLIERGIHTPKISTLFRIARSLGTTPAKLLAGIEDAAVAKPAVRKKTPKPEKPTKTVVKKRPKPL